MNEGQPSRTAEGVAMRRAAHQMFDIPPVFEDPIALKIIGPEAASQLSSGEDPHGPRRYLRAFLAVRSRYAEDQLAEAVKRGIRQYVILGAGFDTFAYRNPYNDLGLRVFEVDHPATQVWKRQCLQLAGVPVPPSVTFVPVDFERQTIDSALAAAGFVIDEPAFFSWLGVTPYLEKETVMSTFRLIRSLCTENSVVFDYGVPPSSLGAAERAAFNELASRVARAGERFRSLFQPESLARSLSEIGFAEIEDLGAGEINNRYFNGRSDGLCVRGGAHLMYAQGKS